MFLGNKNKKAKYIAKKNGEKGLKYWYRIIRCERGLKIETFSWHTGLTPGTLDSDVQEFS